VQDRIIKHAEIKDRTLTIAIERVVCVARWEVAIGILSSVRSRSPATVLLFMLAAGTLLYIHVCPRACGMKGHG
jgi:hypothetical protein